MDLEQTDGWLFGLTQVNMDLSSSIIVATLGIQTDAAMRHCKAGGPPPWWLINVLKAARETITIQNDATGQLLSRWL